MYIADVGFLVVVAIVVDDDDDDDMSIGCSGWWCSPFTSDMRTLLVGAFWGCFEGEFVVGCSTCM